jgi:hypothetical protein
VLVHCHAGCSQENVIAALKQRDLWHESRPSAAVNRSGLGFPRHLERIDPADCARSATRPPVPRKSRA